CIVLRLSLISIYSCPHPRALPSFPTRRSSDLVPPMAPLPMKAMTIAAATPRTVMIAMGQGLWFVRASPDVGWSVEWESFVAIARSEEHTSELQSRFELVCRLLLEKKKRTVCGW